MTIILRTAHYHIVALMILLLFLTILVATIDVASATVHRYNEKEDDGTYKFDNLVAWVRHNGGRVHDHLGLTNHEHSDRLVRGGVAIENIKAGSELLFLPWNIVFGTIDDTAAVPDNKCEVLQRYASEVDRGRESFWYPYLALDDSLSSRVPSLWNELAMSELQGLPPYGSTGGLTDWYSSNCADGVSFSKLPSSSRQALLAAITRAAGLRWLPIFDLLNHHNGMLNTQSVASHKGNTVTTTKDIVKGEEIFMTYRGGKENTVPDLFRRYGFVEEWPQYYEWEGENDKTQTMQFLILPGEIVAIYPSPNMMSHIGHSSLIIEDLLASIEKHNQSLLMTKLIEFRKMAVALIETFSTSVEEDTVILQTTKDNLLMISKDLFEEIEQQMDISSAISYRIHLKQAIQIGLDATNRLLDLHGDTAAEL